MEDQLIFGGFCENLGILPRGWGGWVSVGGILGWSCFGELLQNAGSDMGGTRGVRVFGPGSVFPREEGVWRRSNAAGGSMGEAGRWWWW